MDATMSSARPSGRARIETPAIFGASSPAIVAPVLRGGRGLKLNARVCPECAGR